MQVGRACPLRELSVQQLHSKDHEWSHIHRSRLVLEDARGIARDTLESLTLDWGVGTPLPRVLAALAAPPRLARLRLTCCAADRAHGPWRLDELAAATQLRHLHIEGSRASHTALLEGVTALEPLAGLTNLETLDVRSQVGSPKRLAVTRPPRTVLVCQVDCVGCRQRCILGLASCSCTVQTLSWATIACRSYGDVVSPSVP